MRLVDVRFRFSLAAVRRRRRVGGGGAGASMTTGSNAMNRELGLLCIVFVVGVVVVVHEATDIATRVPYMASNNALSICASREKQERLLESLTHSPQR